MSARHRPDGFSSVITLVATALGVLPMLLLTSDRAWLGPATLLGLVLVGTGAWLRSMDTRGWLVVGAQLALVVLAAGATASTSSGIARFVPLPSWWQDIPVALGQASEIIRTEVTPLDPAQGVAVLLIGGTGLITVVIDFATHTPHLGSIAGIPLLAVYSVAASVLLPDLPWYIFVSPAIGFLLVLVSESRRRVSAWATHPEPARRPWSGMPHSVSTGSMLRGGRRVGVSALALAVLVPALFPTIGAGWWDGLGRGGDGQTIRTDNPIVDLQRDLTRPDNVEILSYSASDERGRYIRTVTLDTFDGEVWRTSDRRVPAEQQVGSGMPDPPGLRDPGAFPTAEYQMSVRENYQSRWLPVPYPARDVSIDGDWRFDTDTLDIVSPDAGTQGRTYGVTALDVRPSAEDLIESGTGRSEAVNQQTELPDDLPDVVSEMAEEITAETSDDFEAAAALQAFFRSDGGFVYDLSTPAGTSGDLLADFLDNRRGYCEQFAATMAIMARSLDIPSRVAVGFTPGELVDGSFVVRAHDAHAWPELYFDGLGWVRFEPTPGIRTGAAPGWTVPPADDPEPTSEPTANSPADDAPAGPQMDPGDPTLGGAASSAGADAGLPTWVWWTVAAVVLVVLLAGTPAILGAMVVRRRWSTAGQAPSEAAEAGWTDLRAACRDYGVAWSETSTVREQARAIRERIALTKEETDLLRTLVLAVESARYSPREPEVGVTDVRHAAQRLRARMRTASDGGTRWRARWFPSAAWSALPDWASTARRNPGSDTVGEFA